MIPDETTVSASRKIQLDQYEPIETHVSETYSVPDSLDTREDYEDWLTRRQESVMAAAERAAQARFEEYVRQENFGD